MRFFTTAALLEIGNHPFPSTALKPDRMMALDYYRRVTELEELNVKLHHEVVSLNKTNDRFILEVIETYRSKITKRKYESRFVVIATGYYDNPNGLGGIPGEQGPNTSYYYTEPHQYFNKDVVIIGAGNSGAEASLELYRHGARVTLVHNHEKPQSTLKYWVGPDLENRLKNQEIKSFMPAKVTQITNEGVELIIDTETMFVPADFIFILTGFHPNVDLFRNWEIKINNDLSLSLTDLHEVVDFPGLYVIGSAGYGTAINKVFIENGREHAISTIRDINAKLNYKQS